MSPSDADTILALERTALERWSHGDPLGFPEIQAPDITYFDDIAAHSRIDGLEAMREYLEALVGQIPEHRYEVVDPKVQLYGDVGILTLRYHTFNAEGAPLTPWKATSVYRRMDDTWRCVHAHWSIVKET